MLKKNLIHIKRKNAALCKTKKREFEIKRNLRRWSLTGGICIQRKGGCEN